jgi:anti-sigma factor RsiW
MMDRDEKILNYVQGRMDAQERAAFDADIAADPHLSAEIVALSAARDAMKPSGAPDIEKGWTRLSSAIDAERFRPANDNRPAFLSLVQVACVAVASVLVWQVAIAPLLGGADPVYAPASAGAEGPGLQVVFKETADIGAVSAVLITLEGSIVSGPGAMGIYRITFLDEAARDAAQAVLSKRSDLVDEVLEN